MTTTTTSYKQKRSTLRAWIKRQKKVTTADELVTRIKRNWPTTTEADTERLYQDCGT
jgi:hypothetical protein